VARLAKEAGSSRASTQPRRRAARARPFSRGGNAARSGRAVNSYSCYLLHWYQTSTGGDDARARRIRSLNAPCYDSSQIGLVGSSISGSLRYWFDCWHAADVRLDWIAFCSVLAKPFRTSSSSAKCGGGPEHRFWIVVCVCKRPCFAVILIDIFPRHDYRIYKKGRHRPADRLTRLYNQVWIAVALLYIGYKLD